MDKVKTSLQKFGNNVSESFSSAGTFCSESYYQLKSKVNNYFESKNYEEDLDAIIEGLHAHTNKRPNFEFSEDFKERISQKKNYLLKQAAMFVGVGALGGAWEAIQSGNPQAIGEFALIGATGAVIIIVVTATGVIVKRILENTDMNFSKTSQAYELMSK